MNIERVTNIFIVIIILIIIANLFGGLTVKENIAINCLKTQGYNDIQVINKAWFFIPFRGGDRADAVRFHMRAVNPAGNQVELYVFSGWLFKAATIRTF